MNSECEERVTKCINNICDTTEKKFEAENYQPEIPNIVLPPPPPFNFQEILKFPQFPLIDVSSPFDNSGLIDLVANMKDFTYYWSNSKQIHKNCQNNICSVTTKTCKNGKCEEKITTEHL